MKIHPFRLISFLLLVLLIGFMLGRFTVSANQEEVIVKEVKYIVMDQEEYEEVYEIEEVEPVLKSLGEYEVTAYCACELCCGEWADGMTFTGDIATEGVTIATYPEDIALGSTVYIEGIGERVAQDIGGSIYENRIDVFFGGDDGHKRALEFGRQTLEVWEVAD